ncbi:YGGT family protein [mine drainage metagenome]|uniref:YGGT family protein n=1 Tax=mine drainage metagenome TaxID=410659 RepID=A0A1J5TSL0_9ZZZZ
MLGETLSFLLDALVQPFAAILLFRFHAVWLRAPMRNPIGEFLMALTDFAVLRLRRFIPAAWKLDTATLLLAFVVEFIYLGAYLWLQGYAFDSFPLTGLLAWTAVKLLKISIYLLLATLIAEAVLSWVNPHTPLAPMLSAVNRPFLQPLRSRIPPVGNVDLSVLVLFLICQLILIVPIGGLEQAVMRLL